MNFNLTPTDYAAYIGAAAWLPKILAFFRELLFKPTIVIKADKYVRLGYTGNGAYFGLRLLIDINKSDILIDHIGIKLQHADGSKCDLEWSNATETFSEITNNKGENQTIQRNITPICIKLNQFNLNERFFIFNETKFIEENRIFLDKLEEIQFYMKKENIAYQDNFLISKEFNDYMTFMKEHFLWKAGVYKVYFYLRSRSKFRLIKNEFEFKLTQDNVDLLTKNYVEIKNSIEDYIKIPHPQDYIRKFMGFIFCSPFLKNNKQNKY